MPALVSDRAVNGPYSCSVNYGDGSGALAGVLSGSVCSGPAHIYGDNGSYQITVTVTDKDGVSGTANQTHQVTNVAPTVNALTINPNPADVLGAVTAAATFADPAGARDAPYRCTVNYGDGGGDQNGTVTGTSCVGPAHAYGVAGSYGVIITVFDKDNGVGSATSTALVTNLPPVVSAPVVSPALSLEASGVTASASFSDGGVNGPYTCTVNDGDGGALAGAVSGSVCNGPAHTYDDNGVYQITVVVTDNDGVSGGANQMHQVINVAPTAVFAVTPNEIFVGESAGATFNSVFDPSGTDTAAGFSYRYDCNDDGVWESAGFSLSSFSCRFINSGTFKVVGEVRDKDGGHTGYSAVVTVLSPQQALQSLIDVINDMVTGGTLNKGQAESLNRKLINATASLDRGNPIAALNQIEALQREVDALTNAAIITAAQGELLQGTAQRVIDAIRLTN